MRWNETGVWRERGGVVRAGTSRSGRPDGGETDFAIWERYVVIESVRWTFYVASTRNVVAGWVDATETEHPL